MKRPEPSSKNTVKTWIKAVLVGLACGVVVFLVSGDGIYMCLFYWKGMDRLPPGSAADAAPGVFWALEWGVFLGAILGGVACVLVTRYYRQSALRRTRSAGPTAANLPREAQFDDPKT
jgi:hypothetical protein